MLEMSSTRGWAMLNPPPQFLDIPVEVYHGVDKYLPQGGGLFESQGRG